MVSQGKLVTVCTRFFLGAVMCVALSACSTFWDDTAPKKKGLKGDRIPVLTFEQSLKEDADLANLRVQLPTPYTNKNWAQAGGNTQHIMQHLTLGDNPKEIWSVNIGSASNSRRSLVSMPVVRDGVLFVMDSMAKITAYNEDNGNELWEKEFKVPGETENISYGGGVSAGPDRLYFTNGYGHVGALSKKTGSVSVSMAWPMLASGPGAGDVSMPP